jgi:hypothetical protein
MSVVRRGVHGMSLVEQSTWQRPNQDNRREANADKSRRLGRRFFAGYEAALGRLHVPKVDWKHSFLPRNGDQQTFGACFCGKTAS